MGIITDLRPQRRKEDRLNVYLDGDYAFSLHVSIANQLEVGQEVTPDQAEELRFRDAVYGAHERAVHFLSYRPRSQQEVADYLGRKGIDPDVIDRAVGELEKVGYVDDVAFARFWVDNREDFRPRSPWVLKQELRQKGISDDVIDQAVADVDEEESAYRAATSQSRRLSHLDYQTFRRRLGGFLQRRGFTYGVIKDVVERVWKECVGDQE